MTALIDRIPVYKHPVNELEIMVIPGRTRNKHSREVRIVYYAQTPGGANKSRVHATPQDVLKALGFDPEAKPTRTYYAWGKPELLDDDDTDD